MYVIKEDVRLVLLPTQQPCLLFTFWRTLIKFRGPASGVHHSVQCKTHNMALSAKVHAALGPDAKKPASGNMLPPSTNLWHAVLLTAHCD